MDLLSQISNNLFSFLIVLTIIVFVHELGHYLYARRYGVKIETFSIGFGRELFGYTDKHGTRWRFSLIPLGGYVQMFGDEDVSSNPDHEKLKEMGKEAHLTMHNKTPFQKIMIAFGGPLANFVFSIVVLTILFATVGQPFTKPVVNTVLEGGAAQTAGLISGDTIEKIDGQGIDRFEDITNLVRANAGTPMRFDILRGEEKLALEVTPQVKEMKDRFGDVHKVGTIGLSSHQMGWEKHNPLTAIYYASKQCYMMITQTLSAIGQMITGARSTDELGGPLRIAEMSGKIAAEGIAALVAFMATLSISLGIINLFPIPALDGGQMVFYALEWVRGKPLSVKAQERIAGIGITLVLALMVFALWNDIVHLRIIESIKMLFS